MVELMGDVVYVAAHANLTVSHLYLAITDRLILTVGKTIVTAPDTQARFIVFYYKSISSVHC